MARRRVWGTLAWALFLALGAVVFTVSPAPLNAQAGVTLPPELKSVALPKDLHISAPDPGVPADLAAYSGVWGGVWGGSLPTILAVESITAEVTPRATVVYAWGRGGPAAPSYYRVQANFVKGELHVAIPSGSTMTYRMRPDGTLDGYHEYRGYGARAILKRIAASP